MPDGHWAQGVVLVCPSGAASARGTLWLGYAGPALWLAWGMIVIIVGQQGWREAFGYLQRGSGRTQIDRA